jgi:hypothetical protein
VLAGLVFGACENGPQPNPYNRRPTAAVIDWPAETRVGDRALFKVECYDPDGDRLRVFVAWGDGDTSDYGEFVQSGQTLVFEHTFATADTFPVRARCHDLEPLFSEWSAPRTVRVTP